VPLGSPKKKKATDPATEKKKKEERRPVHGASIPPSASTGSPDLGEVTRAEAGITLMEMEIVPLGIKDKETLLEQHQEEIVKVGNFIEVEEPSPKNGK